MEDEINEKIEEIEERDVKENYTEVFKYYFDKYKDFFPNEQSKAVFLGGALAGLLLEVQRSNNPSNTGNEPFWRSLHGLNIDSRIFQNLYPKIVDKLKMLKRSYSGFIKVASEYMQRAGNFDKMSKLEVSWFFTHGLSSYQNLKPKKKKGE